ncbi:hypothetical protein AK51_21935 [Serratia nematodiphila DZ0503SBS1]|nr:hypothetical protein AK51_21935 [Serratia nematodiphila DZ0503SBS1]
MPGALVEGHILHDLSAAANQAMRRHSQLMDIGEIRVLRRVERAGEQLVDIGAAELAGRQADVVDDQQRGVLVIRAPIAVRREHSRRPDNPAIFQLHQTPLCGGTYSCNRVACSPTI